jgi:L-threonylcarbamoyladenylate synthase
VTTADVAAAVAVLRAGGLVAFPTETVYGLGADAANPDAVRRVYRVKGRPAGHPLIVHVGSAAALRDWAADVPRGAEALAAACWPGPLTLLLPRRPDVDATVAGGRDTIGLRVPAAPSRPRAAPRLRRRGRGAVRQPLRPRQPDDRRPRPRRPR